MNFKVVAAALSAALIFGAVEAHAAVTLNFPSADSETFYLGAVGVLGAGGGGHAFATGNSVSETFVGTGLAEADAAHWQFRMSNFTNTGVTSTFNVLINGVTIDDFSFVSVGSGDVNFDFTSQFGPIAGDAYILSFVATSTVPGGEGSWNFYPDGQVTLSGGALTAGVPEPASWALMILGFGAAGGALRSRRRVVAAAA
jgi:hypothetical protein